MRSSKATMFLIPFFLLAAVSPAQLIDPRSLTGNPTPPGRRNTFGTASQSVLTIGAFDLSVPDSSGTWKAGARVIDRYMTNESSLYGSVRLPSGALVERIELEACDGTNTGEVVAGFYRKSAPGEELSRLGLIETGDVATPGCANFPLDLETSETIDNKNFDYAVALTNSTVDGTTTIVAMRIYYRLQLSPAPATATFGDVPANYLYFRAIEALAAAGITTGCGNGNFCPNNNVTRGELAKFLANALGLFWQN